MYFDHNYLHTEPGVMLSAITHVMFSAFNKMTKFYDIVRSTSFHPAFTVINSRTCTIYAVDNKLKVE